MRPRYFTNRKLWRNWLIKYSKTKKEIWVIFYKKWTGKKSLSYHEALEEALCFGWIDSIVRKIDESRYAQKFTPRKLNNNWSLINLKIIKQLIKNGLMTKAGMIPYESRKKKKLIIKKLRIKKIRIPTDFRNDLKRRQEAWKNWNRLALSYRKNYIGWIIEAKKEITRKRRIKQAIILIAKNIKNPLK